MGNPKNFRASPHSTRPGARNARTAMTVRQQPTRSDRLDEISITIAFALLGVTWLTLRGMDGRARRRTRR